MCECSKKRAYREIYYDIIFPYQCPIVVIINISFTCIRLKWVFVYSIRVSWSFCFSHSLRFVCVYACSRRTLICISIVTNVIACKGGSTNQYTISSNLMNEDRCQTHLIDCAGILLGFCMDFTILFRQFE